MCLIGRLSVSEDVRVLEMDGGALYQCEVTVLYTLMVHQGEDSEVIV